MKSCICLIFLFLFNFCAHNATASSLPQWKPPAPRIVSTSVKKSDGSKRLSSKARFIRFINNITTGTVEAGPRFLHQILYWITAADAVQSVLRNQYTDIVGVLTRRPSERHMVPSVYSRIFYFARLRPRLLYAVGSLLRALQLCTPLERILDPSIGVGAGINLCAILASSRWVKPVVLGWCTTKYVWKWLGAQRVSRAFLPITLSIREWEEQKKKKGSKIVED